MTREVQISIGFAYVLYIEYVERLSCIAAPYTLWIFFRY